jgi:hypothetical protein
VRRGGWPVVPSALYLFLSESGSRKLDMMLQAELPPLSRCCVYRSHISLRLPDNAFLKQKLRLGLKHILSCMPVCISVTTGKHENLYRRMSTKTFIVFLSVFSQGK